MKSEGYSRSCAKTNDPMIVVVIADTSKPIESPESPMNRRISVDRINELQVINFDRNINANITYTRMWNIRMAEASKMCEMTK